MGVTRFQMFADLGLVHVVERVAVDAYKEVAEREWRSDFLEAPHGQAWHTSFHASQFPGDDPMTCGRKAIYTLMNIPRPKPIDRAGKTVMSVGKAIEYEFVKTLADAGVLISSHPDNPVQTGFTINDAWLTGNTDAVVLPHGWNRGHVIEVKTKDGDVVQAMRRGERGPDPEHIRQAKTYIGMAHAASAELWPHLEPVTSGSIYYMSRNRPNMAAEFFYQMDEAMYQEGIVRLQEWKEDFLADRLPRRPETWMWSESSCKYCQYKNMKLASGEKAGCKEDVAREVVALPDSTTINFATDLNPDYDYDATKKAVTTRWTTPKATRQRSRKTKQLP